jgi:peptide/nickel transport system substrate-binding protein
MIICGLLIACTAPATTTQAPSDAEAEAPAAEAGGEPAGGGTLNYAFSQEIRDFNALTATQGVQAEMIRLIFSSLIQYDVALADKIPALAESFEVTDDNLTVIFHLRDGVTWHDGEPFTAEDVEFTYTLALNPATGSIYTERLRSIEGAESFSNGESDSVSGIEVVDDLTISFTLSQPDAVFVEIAAVLSILPQHILGDVAPENLREHEFMVSRPVGTGPFILENYTESQFVEFVRNENYFRGAPRIERINWLIVDSEVTPAGLERGEIDITSHVPAADLERFIDNPDFKIYWQTSTVFCNITVNTAREYLTPEVRQAMLYAIDRETLVNEFHFGGQASIVWTHHLGHNWLLPNEELNEYAYNPDMARELLESAGWDPEQVVDFTFAGGEPADEVLFMAQNLEDVGIDVELRSRGDGAAASQAFYEAIDHDIAWGCNEMGFDPHWTANYYLCDAIWANGGYNAQNYCNPEVDALYEQARFTLDQEERKEIYQQIQKILNEDLSKIVVRLVIRPWVMRARVQDATPEYHGSAPNNNAIEKWWLSE